MILTILIAFIFSLRHYGRDPALRILSYYFAFFLLSMGVEFYLYISPRDDRFANDLASICFCALVIFEFCVFSLLILHYITGPGRRLAIKLNTVIFFLVEIFLYFREFPRNPFFWMG